MRKTRDFDAELKELSEKARLIKSKKVQQLGDLVIATGADAFDRNTLAGLLLAGVECSQDEAMEDWRTSGASFFRKREQGARRRSPNDIGSVGTDVGDEA
jgi:hypothetical protein